MVEARNFAEFCAAVAALAMAVTPLSAAAVAPPQSIAVSSIGAVSPWSAEADTAHGWRDRRDYRGWGHRHRDRGIDAGDIILGAAILGGIFAIANAAKKAEERRRDERYEDAPDDGRYRDRPDHDGAEGAYEEGAYDPDRSGSGYSNDLMNIAVDNCAVAVERRASESARVEAITSVRRDGAGWNVEGELDRGEDRDFLCGTDAEGRVEFVQFGADALAFAD